ncbi:hypothetical protein ES708_20043 [subsurface metagenome]
MGYHDDCGFFIFIQVIQNIHNFGTHFTIEVAGWLIGKDYLRPADNSSCNGYTLFLPAGKLAWVMFGSCRQTYFFKRF